MNVQFDKDRIEEFCVKYGIRRFSLFGSVLRDDFRPDSDIDVHVEFDQHRVPGFFTFARMQSELSQMLNGRTVQLCTPGMISHHFRQQVQQQAESLYAA